MNEGVSDDENPVVDRHRPLSTARITPEVLEDTRIVILLFIPMHLSRDLVKIRAGLAGMGITIMGDARTELGKGADRRRRGASPMRGLDGLLLDMDKGVADDHVPSMKREAHEISMNVGWKDPIRRHCWEAGGGI